MKFSSSLFCLLIALLSSAARAGEPTPVPTFEWVVSAGGKLHDKTRGIAVDPHGNILLTGEFTGEATFGKHTLTAKGQMDFFVAKVSPKGEFLWVRSGGGSKIDRGYAVATDNQGFVSVTGHFQSEDATFGTFKPTLAGDYDIFIARYDNQGNLLWLKTAGGTGYDYGHGIAVDMAGDIVVTGAQAGMGTIDGQRFGETGSARVFCLKLNSVGKILWSQVASGAGSSSGHGIAVDDARNIYVGGSSNGVGRIASKDYGRNTGHDILVIKFTHDGNAEWIHDGHGSTNAMIHEITADNKGNVWASGMFKANLKLQDRTVISQGDQDLLLTSFNTTGKRLWTWSAGGPKIDYGLGIAHDGRGNAFLTGSFTGQVEFGAIARNASASSDIFVVSFDRNGSPGWFAQVEGKGTDHAYAIVSDKNGGLYLSGACSGNANFGAHTLVNHGSNDLFLAKLKYNR